MELVSIRPRTVSGTRKDLFTGWRDVDLAGRGVEAKLRVKIVREGYEFDVPSLLF